MALECNSRRCICGVKIKYPNRRIATGTDEVPVLGPAQAIHRRVREWKLSKTLARGQIPKLHRVVVPARCKNERVSGLHPSAMMWSEMGLCPILKMNSPKYEVIVRTFHLKRHRMHVREERPQQASASSNIRLQQARASNEMRAGSEANATRRRWEGRSATARGCMKFTTAFLALFNSGSEKGSAENMVGSNE